MFTRPQQIYLTVQTPPQDGRQRGEYLGRILQIFGGYLSSDRPPAPGAHSDKAADGCGLRSNGGRYQAPSSLNQATDTLYPAWTACIFTMACLGELLSSMDCLNLYARPLRYLPWLALACLYLYPRLAHAYLDLYPGLSDLHPGLLGSLPRPAWIFTLASGIFTLCRLDLYLA